MNKQPFLSASNTTTTPIDQAIENGCFYGLEYVLDELAMNDLPAQEAKHTAIDWFGATDYFA